MDRLLINRDFDAFCGTGIAFDYVFQYIEENKTKDKVKIAIISDREVSGYYYNRFVQQFVMNGIEPVFISVDSTDKEKSLVSVDRLIKHLNDFSFGSDDWFIALGGGGVLDITTFACRIIEFDIKLMLVPTTLNAMEECALSDRCYLNSMGNKNHLALPSYADALIVDPSFLDTVPAKLRSNGYAPIIRLAVLYDASLLNELKKPNNLREFLNKCYNIRSEIEKVNSSLLTMGNELAEAVESYFRFLNYTEGEILALSILATVDDKRREVLKIYYKDLGLPVILEGANSKLILKMVSDRFDKNNNEFVEVVDLYNGKWAVRKLNREGLLKLCEQRIKNISASDDNESN